MSYTTHIEDLFYILKPPMWYIYIFLSGLWKKNYFHMKVDKIGGSDGKKQTFKIRRGAHACPAAPCYFGVTPGSGKLCKPTPHSWYLPRLVPFWGKRGREEGWIHQAFAVSLFIHLSSHPVKGSISHLPEKPQSPQAFFFWITLAARLVLSSPLRAFITQSITQRSFSFLFCFLCCHIILLPWGNETKNLLSKAWRWGQGNTKKETTSLSHVYHV